jgi:hypothetical protein
MLFRNRFASTPWYLMNADTGAGSGGAAGAGAGAGAGREREQAMAALELLRRLAGARLRVRLRQAPVELPVAEQLLAELQRPLALDPEQERDQARARPLARSLAAELMRAGLPR